MFSSTDSRSTKHKYAWEEINIVASHIRHYYVPIHISGNSLCLLPPQQWASLYQPLIFNSEVGSSETPGDVHLNKLDPTKAFKGKAKAPVPKKKQPAQCSSGAAAAATKSSAGKQTGTKRWEESRLKTFPTSIELQTVQRPAHRSLVTPVQLV